jgi:16S rRNA (uracil1498-N3)-methyltransferase
MDAKFALMSDPSIRLFVTATLQQGEAVPAGEGQAHYLTQVMRRKDGDLLRVFNGRDGEWRARILASSRKTVLLEPLAQLRPQAAEPDCWLCFALLKRQKTDLVVEKATELGVCLIQPIITERTQADHVNLDRLRAIAIEAAEQCERLAVPEIRPPLRLAQLLAGWPSARQLYIADERRTGKTARPPADALQPIALMTGPEGGFTDAELDGIGNYPGAANALRVSLGARILRAETAVIAGLALLLAAGPAEE